MLTVLSSVQNAINSQPLTYRCSENAGLEEIIPNSFLRPFANKTPFFSNDNPDILKRDPPSRIAVKKFLNKREKLLEEFRQEWYDLFVKYANTI